MNVKTVLSLLIYQLTEEEYDYLQFQFETAKGNNMSGTLPYAFIEQGVAMLATVLRTPVAEEVSIRTMDAFVAMRKYISSDLIDYSKMLINHENRLTIIENTFDNFKEQNNHLFFEGQIYDAYSLMLSIFDNAKESIVIIDNYIDKNILDILSKTDKIITLVTNKYNNVDYEKYKEQYNNVTLIINNSFHDRYIIIDKKVLYHSGASFKDLGKKCFSITKIDDKEILDNLLSKCNYSQSRK